MKTLIRFCALILLTSSFTVAQAASEVIELNYRMAQDVLPVVQSVLGSEGRASAYGNQLIVNASPEKISELRSVLDSIDTQPRRLLITVDTQVLSTTVSAATKLTAQSVADTAKSLLVKVSKTVATVCASFATPHKTETARCAPSKPLKVLLP